MTTAQVVETSVTVNNNSPIQDYVHPNDQTQPTFEKTVSCYGWSLFQKTQNLDERIENDGYHPLICYRNRFSSAELFFREFLASSAREAWGLYANSKALQYIDLTRAKSEAPIYKFKI